MKKQKKKSERKTTVIRKGPAPVQIIPTTLIASTASDPLATEVASIASGLKIGAYLRSLWLRFERVRRMLRYRLNKGMHPLVLRAYITWMRRHSLNLALIVVTIALVIFLSFISWLHLTSTHNIAIKQAREAYFEQMNKEQSTDAAQRAWKRLHSKHGYPAAVIYEPGQTPYYINKSSQRCRFV